MKLKRLGAAFIVAIALGVVMASSAFAARAVTQDVLWTIEGTTITSPASLSSVGANEFVWKVGTTPLSLKSTGLNCLSCTISNSGGSAVGSGSLEFTGVTVVTPSTCAARSVGASKGIVKTVPLTVEADYMKEKEQEPNYILFKPAASTPFVELELLKGSGDCPIQGKYKITGEVFTKSVNGTGVDAVTQTVESSGAINQEASGKTEPLLFGGIGAELNGFASFALSGANKSKKFGTK